MRNKILAIIMMLILVLSNVPITQAATIKYKRYKNFKYEFFDYKSIGIRYYTGKKSTVTIPEKIKEKKVRYVFLIKAKNFKKIKLSSYVKDVHLARNRKLKKVTINKKNKYLCVKNNIVLNKKKTKLVSVLGGYDEITVPMTVKRLGNSSFCGSKIKKLTITKNVEEIEPSTFTGCKKLKTIIFEGDSIPKIGFTSFGDYLNELNFYVKNEQLVEELINELNGKYDLNAHIYVGNKLVCEKEIRLDEDWYFGQNKR